MAGVIRSVVTIAHDTGLPEDSVVNVWHFQGATPFQASDLTAINNKLQSFYVALNGLFSGNLNGQPTVKHYFLEDAEPRVPRGTYTMSGVTLGSLSLPEEVALCLSFQGVQVSGSPQARRRGRIFLGPLAQAVNNGGTGRPGSTDITTIKNAAIALKAASGPPWVVYSRVDDIGYTVNNGWVDNSFDTQRRRGLAATSRNVWS